MLVSALVHTDWLWPWVFHELNIQLYSGQFCLAVQGNLHLCSVRLCFQANMIQNVIPQASAHTVLFPDYRLQSVVWEWDCHKPVCWFLFSIVTDCYSVLWMNYVWFTLATPEDTSVVVTKVKLLQKPHWVLKAISELLSWREGKGHFHCHTVLCLTDFHDAFGQLRESCWLHILCVSAIPT